MQTSPAENFDRSQLNAQKEESLLWLKENLAPLLNESNLFEKESLFRELNLILVEKESLRCQALESLSRLLDCELLPTQDVFELLKTSLLTMSTPPNEIEIALKTLADLPGHSKQVGELILDFLDKTVNSKANFDDTTGDVIACALDILSYRGVAKALPVLDALRQNCPAEKVKESAHRAMAALKNTVSYLYRETPVDLVSTNQFRASELMDCMNDPDLLEQEKIQALFNVSKEVSIDEKTDPLLRPLNRLFDNDSERLRLALCLTMSDMILGADLKDEKRQLIDCLTDLGVNAGSPAIALEACQILENLEKSFPTLKATIERARENANLAYLKRFNF